MQFCLPDLGEGIVEAELVEWLVKPGDVVEHGQNLAEVMTDKATLELPSSFQGKIMQLLVDPGEQVKIDGPLLEYESETAASMPTTILSEPPTLSESRMRSARTRPAARHGNGHARPAVAHTLKAEQSVKAAPAVRRMASQLGIDLSRVHGSGPRDRILIDDLAAAVKQTDMQSTSAAIAVNESRSDKGMLRPGSRIKLRGLRRKIAERMAHAKQTIPHYSYVDECDVTGLVRMRESLKEPLAEQGIKLTYLPFIVKAVVAALKEVPLANASLDNEAGEIVLHDRYHIGIATNTPRGLIVPVIRDADRKGLPEIAGEIERLTEAARNRKASAEQLRGSTFTITSTGKVGALISTPIINEPEVGILGVGRIVRRPSYDDAGNVRPSQMLYLSFSFDHRVIDGAVAAQVAGSVIRSLQRPATMLLPDSAGV